MPKRYLLNKPELLPGVTTALSTCKDVHIHQRLLAVRMAVSGRFTAAQIAEQIGVSRRRFFDWMGMIKEDGLISLLRRQHGGGPRRRLTVSQLAELTRLLSGGATLHGWDNNLWTTLRVREVIKRHFGIAFSRGWVWRILTEYLHWSAIRPVQQAAERDEKEIVRWKAEEFPRIERRAKEKGAYLIFIDESGFMMTPTIRRTFAPRGSKPVNKIADPHGRISVIGALTVSPNRRRLGLQYLALDDNVNFRWPQVITFLKQLGSHICKPICLVWDQVPTHSAGGVLNYLKSVPDVAVEFFPAYAPELNPVDRVWRYIKHGRLPNYTPVSMVQLRASVVSELKLLQARPKLLRSFILQSEVPVTFSSREHQETFSDPF